MQKITAMIPARYAATRFPAKLMQQLGSKTVIRTTYDNTVATGLFDDVYVVTDSSPMDDGTGAAGNTLFNGWTTFSHIPLFMNASLWLAKLQ